MNALETRLRLMLQPWLRAPAWCIAYSGGLDSTVLLHLLASWARQEKLPPLRALHVQHGLQAAAQAWPAHCARFCQQLGVSLEVLEVSVEEGASLEQAARRARYAAFARHLQNGELLICAQHRDDQAETLLFRLLRGAGVRGLSGMPARRTLGRGQLLRPLLDSSRAELMAYARQHGLSWVEDPSNADERFSRNFLRRQVLPLLQQRWPQASTTLARSAGHCAEAQQLLGELAELDLAVARGSSSLPWLSLPSLQLSAVAALGEARQRNLLRHWLADLTRMPDSEHWAGWQNLRDARIDAEPVWQLEDGQLHRSDDRLWWLSGDWLDMPAPLRLPWIPSGGSSLLPGNGRVWLLGELPAGRWQLRYRSGGESMQLAGRGRRELKRLLNEWRVPAFVRGRLPLLFDGEELVAVANLACSARLQNRGVQLCWSPPTGAQRLSW
ncbi:tRNA lysidine(34) synthetase TilS [Pseudomonas sp. NCCP-436]|uniref:tRNA lysidine(34) synthetase TilS n=1 Tax=Pseudomonas sp. NCCP-436 TaxID=2842481 RepID=UPI001C825D4C|nr:tRNA lysidine(34) synthetase TilS [Pseudomonas sp. NCCP-436]GIZ11356.1 tRNA(Ile)-lysidine synthase [Pseudomonas sp. NCCP-436]